MQGQLFIVAIVSIMLLYFASHVFTRAFDPFAPVWLFLLGYAQVYVIQAISYHEWAIQIRGKDLVETANFRALWATCLVSSNLPPWYWSSHCTALT